MDVEPAQRALARVERNLLVGAVLATFLSIQISSSPLYLLLLWCGVAGLLCAYFVFRNLPRLPNLLFHMKHPHRTPAPSRPLNSDLSTSCPVCNKQDCKRHDKARKEYFNPWDGLTLPQSIDGSLSEILEIIMQRFVYSWHRYLAPNSESIEDEIRVAIRHSCSIMLRRAKRLDVPLLISSKFLQAISTHVHFYVKGRRKLPVDATVADIEAAVFKEYGDRTHSAMKGATGNIKYFRHLVKALLPLLLPRHMLRSKIICGLVEELFADKIFVPAMNFTAKPDFINLLIYRAFDKNSRLEAHFGPPTREVSFLSKWASTRSYRCNKPQPLDIPLPELLEPQHHLYTFMQYMKSMGEIHILQVYLTLNDLKHKVSSFEPNQAPAILSLVENLHQTYFLQTSSNYLQLDLAEVAKITQVLEEAEEESSAVQKCEKLKRLNVFGRLKGYIYSELLMKHYYPHFLLSMEFYEVYLGKENGRVEAGPGQTKGDRWRQKTRKLKKLSQPSITDNVSEDSIDAAIEEDAAASEQLLVPRQVQIVDAETHMDALRPYTEYIIMVKRDNIETVRRRYKEFVVFDTKLRQFYGDINVSLPSKKAFRNMEKAFIETRCKELNQYLATLMTIHKVLNSQIFASFLSATSDPSMFLPDSVTDKMIKKVKRDNKAQHYEELMQTLLQEVEPPNNQPSPQTVARITAQTAATYETRNKYLAEAADDMFHSSSSRYKKQWLQSSSKEPPTAPLNMERVMDLLVFVAVSIYQVTPVQLTALMLTKLLAQETIETIAYEFVAGKVNLMTTEAHVLRLIEVFKKNVFDSKAPPRTEAEMRDRLKETFERLQEYPNPLIRKIIGEQRFIEGTAVIMEGLQCRELNKQLFFQLLDIILLELFPELGEEEEEEEAGVES